MARNLKVLGLLAAIFAFSAVASGSAVAMSEFHCTEKTHCIMEIEREGVEGPVLKTESGSTSCLTVRGDSTIVGSTAMEATFANISYAGCSTTTIFGKIPVNINFNGCDYLFTTSTEPVHLVCPAGKEVTIVGPGCTITIPGGQTLTQIHYLNLFPGGTTGEITIETTITNIKTTGTGAFCTKQGIFTNGSYNGNVRVTGKTTEGVHTGISYV